MITNSSFVNMTNKVWIGLLLSILACIGFIWMMVLVKRKRFGNENDQNMRGFANLNEVGIYVFATLTNHGIANFRMWNCQIYITSTF